MTAPQQMGSARDDVLEPGGRRARARDSRSPTTASVTGGGTSPLLVSLAGGSPR